MAPHDLTRVCVCARTKTKLPDLYSLECARVRVWVCCGEQTSDKIRRISCVRAAHFEYEPRVQSGAAAEQRSCGAALAYQFRRRRRVCTLGSIIRYAIAFANAARVRACARFCQRIENVVYVCCVLAVMWIICIWKIPLENGLVCVCGYVGVLCSPPKTNIDSNPKNSHTRTGARNT